MTLSKEQLLGGSDLAEKEIDLPALGGSVRVRALAAAYANQAQADATETVIVGGEQQVRFNLAKLEVLQVLHGLIEPKLDTFEEAEQFSKQVGSSWRTIVKAIDDLSGVDKEAIEKANTLFQPGGQSEGIQPAEVVPVGERDGGPDLHVRTGARAAHAGQRDVSPHEPVGAHGPVASVLPLPGDQARA